MPDIDKPIQEDLQGQRETGNRGLPSLLVSTKFAPPRISACSILRQNLLARLNQARNCKLLIVSGSAGFGKTTLIAQWRIDLIKSGAAAAWISLANDDGPCASFCLSLIGALQQSGISIEDDLLNDADDKASMQAIVARVVNAIAKINSEFYLMIDDFQYLTDMQAMKFMQMLIEVAPPNLHVVIASRTVPSLPLGRLRATGELAEIKCGELPFEFGESFRFLNSNMLGKIDMDSARAIHDLTDGWPIGLQLVAIALKANPRTRFRLHRLAPRTTDLEAYLAEEVISHLPLELLTFMEKLSLFRRFNADLATEVTGSECAAELIHSIEARCLFLFPIDAGDRQEWYRFHPMFADFLMKRLIAGGNDIAALHRKAASWFATNDLPPEAIRHALLGDDAEMAVRLVESRVPTLSNLRHLGTIVRWLDRLPMEVVAQHPRLLMVGCMAFALTARPAKAETYLAQLSAHQGAYPTSMQIAVLRGIIASVRDDYATIVQLASRLADVTFSEPFFEHVRVSLLLLAHIAAGNYVDAQHCYLAAASRFGDTARDELALIAAAGHGFATMLEGNLAGAVEILEESLSIAQTMHGRRSISAVNCAALLSSAYYEQGRLDVARDLLSNRVDMLKFSFAEFVICGFLCHARLKLVHEGAEAALGLLADQAAFFRTRGVDRAAAAFIAEQVRILVSTEDLRRAAALQGTLDELASRHADDDGWFSDVSAVAAIARARLALAMYKPQDALDNLLAVRRHCLRYNKAHMSIICDLLWADALHDLGQSDEADAYLKSALESGCRMDLLRVFIDHGEGLRVKLIGWKDKVDKTLAAYIEHIVGNVPHESSADVVLADVSPAQTIAELATLTQREREILSLLERSMSNKRIASTLSISVETVKWNLKNVFAKLNVSTRYDAATRARQLGIARLD